ncbi:MAG TPA: ABC transporter ATP-binding protein [Longilinea sp.]|nr:ABC transporter ATP-binding protein [Longilinea sp.]
MDLINTTNLCKSFGNVHAVDHLSLSVRAGEIYGLVGPDGAGKTTTLRLLCGAIHADEGEINLAGIDLRRRPEHAREQIGYLSQRFSLYEDLTVMENLRFFAEVRGLGTIQWKERAEAMLSFVGLQEFQQRRAGQLSGGMKQKLALAASLIHEPKILLLDEPTTGVDPVTRQDFWQLIIRVVEKEGVAVLLCTPYMDEATRCTKVGFLRQGRLIVEGKPHQVRARLDRRIIEVTGSPMMDLMNACREIPVVKGVQRFGDRLHLRLEKADILTPEDLKAILKAKPVTITGCQFIEPFLEDVFIALAEETE